jgi:two-component system response regulator FixJ
MSAARIFVADDDADVGAGISMILEFAGWEVETFPDGQACLDAIEASPPECIVSDLDMPKLDGAAMINLLDARGCKVPVVVITAASEKSPLLDAVRGKVFLIIGKPCSSERLEAAVRGALASGANPA